MRLTFIATAVTVLPILTLAAGSTQPTWKTSSEGQLVLRPFHNAPYPHPSRAKGFKGRATTYPADPHYTDSTVGIFIPSGYVPGNAVEYDVHFHGHDNHVSKVITQYKLAEQFALAKVNAILIVPQGPKDAADSGGGKLELDDGAFAKLIDEATAYLVAEKKIHTTTIGRIVLSTHSGGYKVTAAILDHGGMSNHITDVLLLDSSYGSLERFATWASASPSHRLVSLFTQHLAQENQELMGMLDKSKVKYQKLDEAIVTDEQLSKRGPSFMATTAWHDQVPQDYFGRLVRTSALSQ